MDKYWSSTHWVLTICLKRKIAQYLSVHQPFSALYIMQYLGLAVYFNDWIYFDNFLNMYAII